MNRKERRNKNIKKVFQVTRYDEAVAEELQVASVKEPDQIFNKFMKFKNNLSDSAYWYILATMWNSCSQQGSDAEWVELFSADRVDRRRSIMKPKEMAAWKKLPPKLLLKRWESTRSFVYMRTPMVSSLELSQYEEFSKDEVIAYFSKNDEFIAIKKIPKLRGIEPDHIIIDDPVGLGENVIERNVEHLEVSELTR